MKMKQIGFALALSAAFGLIACGDDSSSSSPETDPIVHPMDSDTAYCKVYVSEAKDTIVTTILGGGKSSVVTTYYEGEKAFVEHEFTFLSKDAFEEDCENLESEDGIKGSCDEENLVIKYTIEQDAKGVSVDSTISQAMDSCDEIDGKSIEDLEKQDDENPEIDPVVNPECDEDSETNCDVDPEEDVPETDPVVMD